MIMFRKELSTNRSSVFKLQYHLVLVTKYRANVINEKISNDLRDIFMNIDTEKVLLSEWNYESDHIHILFEAAPNLDLSVFINSYKSASSRVIKKNTLKLKKNYGKMHFGQNHIVFRQQEVHQ